MAIFLNKCRQLRPFYSTGFILGHGNQRFDSKPGKVQLFGNLPIGIAEGRQSGYLPLTDGQGRRNIFIKHPIMQRHPSLM